MNLKQVFSKNQLIIPLSLLVFSALSLIIVSFFILQEKKAIVNQKKELFQLKRDLELLDKILVDRKQNEEKIQKVAKTLPVTYEEVALAISEVETIATDSSQTLETKIEENSVSEQNDLSSIKVTLKTSGSYDNFSKFLTSFAQSPYHTRIDVLKIEKSGQELVNTFSLRLFLGQKGSE